MLETVLATLVIGMSADSSQMPTPNVYMTLPSKEACVSTAIKLKSKFEEEFPTGTFVGVCQDSAQHTFYKVRNTRQYSW